MAKKNSIPEAEVFYLNSDNNSGISSLIKSDVKSVESQSKQIKDKTNPGEITPPYSYDVLTQLYEINTYHSRCIQIKAALTCMLGYQLITEGEDKKPDSDYNAIMAFLEGHSEYAGQSLLTTLYNFCIDDNLFGNSFFEIVRNNKGEIGQFLHLPTKETNLKLSSGNVDLIQRKAGESSTFMQFGKKNESEENEYLHMKNYSPRSRYYGVPDYIGVIGAIVLDRSAVEFNARRFDNNMIIESVITLIGGKISADKQREVADFFNNNHKGLKNVGKNLLIAFESGQKDKIEFRIDKVASEVKEASFRLLRGDNKEEIAAAHGVPPRLVGIMNGAQLGGSGEAKEQMAMFRDITIKPRQKKLEFLFNNFILKHAFPKNKKWKIEFDSFDIDDAVSDANFYKTIMDITDENGQKVLTSPQIAEELGYTPRKEGEVNNKSKPDVKGVEFLNALKQLKKSLSEHR